MKKLIFLSNIAKLTEIGKKTLRNAEMLGFDDDYKTNKLFYV